MYFKTLITGMCMLVFFAMGLVSSVIGEEVQGKLPPNVQVYRGGDAVEDNNGFNLKIYTKDNPAKVTEYYRKALRMDPMRGRTFYLGEDVLNLNRPSEADEAVYLTVFSAQERERGDNNIDESDIFKFLQDEMQKQKMLGTAKHSDREFQEVKQKYAHLAKAWYPDFDVKEKLHTCKTERKRNVDAIEQSNEYYDRDEEFAMKIQQLVAQGRLEEAKQMANEQAQTGKSVQDEGTKDYWNNWLGCLDEINKHAFQTQIVIGLVRNNFRKGTQTDRERATSNLDRQNRQSEQQKSQTKPSETSNPQMDKQLKKLKGMFGF